MAMAMSRAVTNEEKLYALFDYYLGTLAQENNFGCPLLNFGTEADDTNPIVKHKVTKAINATESVIAKLVKAGVEAGEFKKNIRR